MPDLENFFGDRRAREIARHITPDLSPEYEVIDIGANDCRVTEKVARQVGSIIPVDILDTGRNKTGLELTIYDGKTLPFPEASFDAALLTFVLHHAVDPAALFDEAKRVIRPDGRIVVIEDTPASPLQRALWEVIHERQHKRDSKLLEAHDIKTAEGWQQFFQQHRMRAVRVERFRNMWISNGFYSHTAFVVEHDPTAT